MKSKNKEVVKRTNKNLAMSKLKLYSRLEKRDICITLHLFNLFIHPSILSHIMYQAPDNVLLN